jgi:hypothetical protein
MTDTLPEKLPLLSPMEQTRALDEIPFADLRGQKARDVLCQAERDLCQSYWVKSLNEIKDWQDRALKGLVRITDLENQLASANKRIEELEKGFIEWIESLPIPMDLTLLHPSEIEFFNKMADTLWKFSDKAKIEQLESEVARLEKQSSPEHIKWEREMERRILLYIREIGIVNRAMTKKSNLIKDLRAQVARLTEPAKTDAERAKVAGGIFKELEANNTLRLHSTPEANVGLLVSDEKWAVIKAEYQKGS